MDELRAHIVAGSRHLVDSTYFMRPCHRGCRVTFLEGDRAIFHACQCCFEFYRSMKQAPFTVAGLFSLRPHIAKTRFVCVYCRNRYEHESHVGIAPHYFGVLCSHCAPEISRRKGHFVERTLLIRAILLREIAAQVIAVMLRLPA